MATNIDDLPISSQTIQNVTLKTTEMNKNNDNNDIIHRLKTIPVEPEQRVDPQINVNQFITDIQQASASGLLSLPSSDIPQTQHHLTQDSQINQNYMPSNVENSDYITKFQTSQDIINENKCKQTSKDNLDTLFSELQIPIIISILYFASHLPIVNKVLFNYIPRLFKSDGNPKLSGNIFNSAFFGLTYYTLSKSMMYLSI